MIGKIRKILACILSIVLITAAIGTVSAYADVPEWVRRANGEEIVPPDPVEEQKKAELEKWKEEKRTTKVPILLYHHITTQEIPEENTISIISAEDFRLHMTAIKLNFSPISLRDYYNYVMCTDGSVSLPKNPIIITFDDGYLSNYELAFPILKELEIPATIFVVTDTVGEIAGGGKVNNSHFTWEQAREMENSGLIEIQSHTVSHLKLTEQDLGEALRQLRKSKYDIEKNLGKECDMIAYPYGGYNDDIRTIAREAGYKMQLLVDDKMTEDEYNVNLATEGTENVTRMTISGDMGNVNVIDIIRSTINKKVVPK